MSEKGRTEKSWRQEKSNPSTETETLESLWSDSVIYWNAHRLGNQRVPNSWSATGSWVTLGKACDLSEPPPHRGKIGKIFPTWHGRLEVIYIERTTTMPVHRDI